MKILNDAFYTDIKVAKECIRLVKNIRSYSTIIEPSAGNGSFSNQIKKCIALDILPISEKIRKQDFFDLKFHKDWGKKILFIGNPPFGSRSVLAKRFIKHAINLNATTIAFVLPDIFSKTSNQKYTLFPSDWKLIVEKKLPENSFSVKSENNCGYQKYDVPCSFYVWTKEKNNLKNLRRWPPKKPDELPKDFSFLKRGDSTADFTINGNSGKIKSITEVRNRKAEHYIKVNAGYTISNVKKILANLKYNKLSSVNGGNYWINQDEIIMAWNNQHFLTKKYNI